MAAKETKRIFHPDLKMIEIFIQDDFGTESKIQVHLGMSACPSCGQAYPKEGNVHADHDISKIVSEHIAHIEANTEHCLRMFEKHGHDVSAVKARRNGRHS